MFTARTEVSVETSKVSGVSDDEDSDDDGGGVDQPVSVYAMRKQAAEQMKKPRTPQLKKTTFANSFFH